MRRLLLSLPLFLSSVVSAQAGLTDAAMSPAPDERYTVELPVSSQESRERQMALARGLAQVLTRLTGRLQFDGLPVVSQGLANAEALLATADYTEQVDGAGGVAGYAQLLRATFQPGAVDALVAAAGLPVWPAERSTPLLWLVIDDGRGPRLVGGQQINVVRPLAQRGREIGLRVLLPAGDPREAQAISALQGGDLATAARLGARYGQAAHLIGYMRRAPEGWQADWWLGVDGNALANWQFVDASPQRVIASGADRAVEALAQREARPAEAVEPETIEVWVGGVDGQDEWLRLASLLQGSPLVREHAVQAVNGDRVALRLSLGVSRHAFDRWLDGGGVLRPVGKDGLADVAYQMVARP